VHVQGSYDVPLGRILRSAALVVLVRRHDGLELDRGRFRFGRWCVAAEGGPREAPLF